MSSLNVSIQIPTYNQEDLISRAIESALAQSYEHIEIVVADDCSTDQTESVVRKFSDIRVKYFKNNKNLGRVGNYRNSLFQYCTGDWVVNLDGDDYFTDPHFIAKAVSSIRNNENVVLYMAQNSLLRKVSKVTRTDINDSELIIDGLKFLENYSSYPCFFHLACVFNKELAVKNNFYIHNCLIADFVSVMRLADDGNFVISDREVGMWDVNQTSASQTLNEVNNKKNIDGLKGLLSNLNFRNSKQKHRIMRELFYVNNYHLISATASRTKFFSSMGDYLKLINFRKRYYWKGLFRYIFKG